MTTFDYFKNTFGSTDAFLGMPLLGKYIIFISFGFVVTLICAVIFTYADRAVTKRIEKAIRL